MAAQSDNALTWGVYFMTGPRCLYTTDDRPRSGDARGLRHASDQEVCHAEADPSHAPAALRGRRLLRRAGPLPARADALTHDHRHLAVARRTPHPHA